MGFFAPRRDGQLNVRPLMFLSRQILIALLCFTTGCAFGQSVAPIYAIYGSKVVGEGDVVYSVSVGILPSGRTSDCQHQIAVFETGFKKGNTTGRAALLPSQCVTTLKPELKDMVDGRRIPNAYVIRISGNWAPVFAAWYNLPPSDPHTMCKKLVDGTRLTIPPSQAEIICIPPQSALSTAQAGPPLVKVLTGSRWQYGLHGAARKMPIGLAFKRGITATVLTLKLDGSLRMDIPCKNEEFLRQFGGEFHIDGTWELKRQNTLTLKSVFRGESMTEVVSVVVEGEELVFDSPGVQKRLGRFTGDIAQPCTYE